MRLPATGAQDERAEGMTPQGWSKVTSQWSELPPIPDIRIPGGPKTAAQNRCEISHARRWHALCKETPASASIRSFL